MVFLEEEISMHRNIARRLKKLRRAVRHAIEEETDFDRREGEIAWLGAVDEKADTQDSRS